MRSFTFDYQWRRKINKKNKHLKNSSRTIHYFCSHMSSLTRGFPMVSVPVLSNTTLFSSLARWRAAPPLMRTPLRAATPVPTCDDVVFLDDISIKGSRAHAMAVGPGVQHKNNQFGVQRQNKAIFCCQSTGDIVLSSDTNFPQQKPRKK